MPVREKQIEDLIAACANQLLLRATESYSLAAEVLTFRLRNTLDKYLLRDDPQASAPAIKEFLDQLQADDLCLAVACELGNSAAWSDLVERYAPTVRSAARSASGSEDAAEDVAQSIWAELHGLRQRDDGKPASKLAYYSGRGSLAGWLRAVVGQLAVDQYRKVSRFVQTEEDAEFDRLSESKSDGSVAASGLTVSANPESSLGNRLQQQAMEKALTQAIAELDSEDRLLVKLYYFDNLRLREAGAVLGVHEATASRRLTRIHSDLRRRVESILTKDCGWSTSETESAFSALGLNLETDLELMVSGTDSTKAAGEQTNI